MRWLALLALTACDSGKPAEQPAGRADTTQVARKTVSTEAFCDVQFAGTTGPKFTAPPLTGGELQMPTSPRWRWVNVWATWCKPCIEEMPRLAKWRDKLGARFDLAFISADDSDATLSEFRAANPGMPSSPRLANPAKQGDWLVSLGLDGAAPLPVHIFIEPGGHVRCARAGGVRETDFDAVAAVLQ